MPFLIFGSSGFVESPPNMFASYVNRATLDGKVNITTERGSRGDYPAEESGGGGTMYQIEMVKVMNVN